jgi:hypothetical protein
MIFVPFSFPRHLVWGKVTDFGVWHSMELFLFGLFCSGGFCRLRCRFFPLTLPLAPISLAFKEIGLTALVCIKSLRWRPLFHSCYGMYSI